MASPARHRSAGVTAVALRELCGRPAAIVTFLNGMWPRRIEPLHCAAVGAALAALHRAGESFAMTRANDLSARRLAALYEACRVRAGEVQPGLAEELGAELADARDRLAAQLRQRGNPRRSVPGQCVLPRPRSFRADRFLFRLHRFSRLRSGDLPQRLVLRGGRQLQRDQGAAAARRNIGAARPLAAAELAALPLLARGSALRFLLTRLFDWLNQPAGALVRPKDPLEYLRKLRFHRGITGTRAYGLDA